MPDGKMAAPVPLLRGPLRAHPLARPFADEVHRIHRRYAAEVVAQHQLCPFLRDVDTGFGEFCVMLDPGPEPDLDAALEVVTTARTQVIHVIFPCLRPPPTVFERFAGRLGVALKRALPAPPVMATFHPDLAGDPADPYRLVGLLRHAPDPFVQLIPEGLHEGGTVFAPLPKQGEPAPVAQPDADHAVTNFERLKGGAVTRIVELLADIHADRDRSYAPFLAELLR